MSERTSDDFAGAVVGRYTEQLLRLVRRQLPERLRSRMDPEDVVQSVYRSFFNRLRQGQFRFEDSHDVWRVLATLTFHKCTNAVAHHQRQRRDVRREKARLADGSAAQPVVAVERTPGPEDVAALYECLERLLAELPPRYATIVSLRLQGEPIAAIAEQVRYSRRTVIRVLGQVQDNALKRLDSAS